MSKKHFEAIARIFSQVNTDINTRLEHPELRLGASEATKRLALELATVCASTNSRFNRTRFLSACGIPEGK